MGSFWGSSFRSTREAQIERLASLAPSNSRFLDIGCGVGHYLTIAKKRFTNLFGVEPSRTSVKIAREKGFTVIHDYFHEGLEFDGGFDAISIIEVLEHLEQPLVLFKQAARLLNENGILLVEVPNGQRIVEKKLFNNLCTDHIQYFSVSSLSSMAHQAGLSIVCVQESRDPNLLELYVKRSTRSQESFTSKRDVAMDRLLTKLSPKDRVSAWGAGAESVSYLAMLQKVTNIQCLFDSDVAKHGHSIAKIPILPPTAENVTKFDKIILFASAHRQQIQEQLNELGFCGELLDI
ncbi:class I SAM-dependent methyltransferase [Neobacillus sp. K501]